MQHAAKSAVRIEIIAVRFLFIFSVDSERAFSNYCACNVCMLMSAHIIMLELLVSLKLKQLNVSVEYRVIIDDRVTDCK